MKPYLKLESMDAIENVLHLYRKVVESIAIDLAVVS